MNLKVTQQSKLLEALKQGPVNSYKATYIMGIKQAPTRIKELRDSGIKINSVIKKDRSVDWVLASDSVVPAQSPRLEDIYVFGADGVARLKVEPRQEVLFNG